MFFGRKPSTERDAAAATVLQPATCRLDAVAGVFFFLEKRGLEYWLILSVLRCFASSLACFAYFEHVLLVFCCLSSFVGVFLCQLGLFVFGLARFVVVCSLCIFFFPAGIFKASCKQVSLVIL